MWGPAGLQTRVAAKRLKVALPGRCTGVCDARLGGLDGSCSALNSRVFSLFRCFCAHPPAQQAVHEGQQRPRQHASLCA